MYHINWKIFRNRKCRKTNVHLFETNWYIQKFAFSEDYDFMTRKINDENCKIFWYTGNSGKLTFILKQIEILKNDNFPTLNFARQIEIFKSNNFPKNLVFMTWKINHVNWNILAKGMSGNSTFFYSRQIEMFKSVNFPTSNFPKIKLSWNEKLMSKIGKSSDTGKSRNSTFFSRQIKIFKSVHFPTFYVPNIKFSWK